MQSITVLCPSPLSKDKATKPLIDEYIKRITSTVILHDLNVKLKTNETDATFKQKQGEALLSAINKLPNNTALIALDEHGKQMDSIAFAKDIEAIGLAGQSNLCFIIGGAFGLSDEVKAMAAKTLSFGHMVWPHKMVSVMLLEQLYRAQQILNGHPYHKA